MNVKKEERQEGRTEFVEVDRSLIMGGIISYEKMLGLKLIEGFLLR